VSVVELDSPALVMQKLTEIEADLAYRQNALETAARHWYQAKREIERVSARALLDSDKGSVTEKKADADLAAYDVEGAVYEAEYEAIKAAVRVLETRASVCQSILRAQGRS
jgi:hypothetical protein